MTASVISPVPFGDGIGLAGQNQDPIPGYALIGELDSYYFPGKYSNFNSAN